MSSSAHGRPSPSVRDAYGFEVKKEYLSLYHKYAPLWEREELERSERWDSFVASFSTSEARKSHDGAGGAASSSLDVALLQWRLSEHSSRSAPAPEWQQHLRSLVQTGVPMALRGRMWKLFLGLDAKRREGQYEKLVKLALPSLSKRRRKPGAATQQLDVKRKVSFKPEAASSPQPPASVLEQLPGAAVAAGSSQPASGRAADGAGTSQADGSGCTAALGASGTAAGAPEPLTPPAAVPPRSASAAGGDAGRLLFQSPLPASAAAALLAAPALQAEGSLSDTEATPAAARSVRRHRAARWHPSSHDWNLQIEKDLHRTFPGHPVMDGSGRSALRRILAAYSRRNPGVGYCQGMNFIAGCLLLFMDEEDAFWCLAVIAEDLLPGYFAQSMIAPQVDQLVFKHCVDARFPTLGAHLEAQGVNVSSVSTQWFLCIFVNSLPLETCLRVWDLFFFEHDSAVLFRIALALVDIYSQALVATHDSVDAFSLLQNMAPMSYDSSRLIDVACIAHASVNAQQLNSLRAIHRTVVLAQFRDNTTEEEEADAWAGSADEAILPQRSATSTPAHPSLTPPPAARTALAVASPGPPLAPGGSPELLEPSPAPAPRSMSLPPALWPGGQDASEDGSPADSGEGASPWSTISATGWHATPTWPATLPRALAPAALSASDAADMQAEQEQESDAGEGEAMTPTQFEAAARQTAELSRRLPPIDVSPAPQRRDLTLRLTQRLLPPAARSLPGSPMRGEALQTLLHTASRSLPGSPAATAGTARPLAAEAPLAGMQREQSGVPDTPGNTPAAGWRPPAQRVSLLSAASVAWAVQPLLASHALAGSECGSSAPSTPTTPASQPAGSLARREEAGAAAGWSSSQPGGGSPSAGEGSAGAGGALAQGGAALAQREAAVHQLLALVEGLEDELFSADGHRHEAQSEAAVLSRTAAELRSRLEAALQQLADKRHTLALLTAKLGQVTGEVEEADAHLAARRASLAAAHAQLAAHRAALADKDGAIADLMRTSAQGGASEGRGPAFFRKLVPSFKRRASAGSLPHAAAALAPAVTATEVSAAREVVADSGSPFLLVDAPGLPASSSPDVPHGS